MMPCAHRKVDGSKNQTTPRPGTQIRVVEEEAALAIFGGGCQRQNRHKTYKQAAEPRRLLSQQACIISGWDYNKLLLQLAVAAGCCCRVLLYCGDESAPPNKWGIAQEEEEFLTTYHNGRQCTHRWGLNIKTNCSLYLRLPSIITAAW